VQTGWFDSHLNGQSTLAGSPVPWYTYAAINFLSPRLKPHMEVFEYGSGNSTLWYAERVAHVVTCEHNREWADIVRKNLPQNAVLAERPLGSAYVDEIGNYDRKFDIVAIDGRMRSACSRRCVPYLSPGGVIIWDNSERQEYQEAMTALERDGFRRIDFIGMGPINIYGSMTSIFYRSDNVLGI
jgi:tRNA A58 N-methylase Trm61